MRRGEGEWFGSENGCRSDRAVTVQIGAILLLAILFSALALYQINVVPAENEAIEFDHNQQAQNEMQELRNAIQNVGTTDGFRATSITLGTQYPTRTFTVNPPDPQGTLETTGERPFSIENASIEGTYYRTTADGSRERVDDAEIVTTHNTTTIAYEPDYNEYETAPTTRLEHSFAFNDFGERSVPLRGADQQLVSNDSITVALIEGELSESASGAVTVDAETLSGPSDPIELTADDGNITVSIPTDHPERWNETLGRATTNGSGTGFDDGEAGVRVLDYDPDGDSLRVEFREESVELRIARIGLNGGGQTDSTFDIERANDDEGETGVRPANPYNVTWVNDSVTASPGEETELTARIDDDIERPLADFAYRDEDGTSTIDQINPDDATFSDGTANVTVRINRTATDGEEATVFVATGGGLAEATVTVDGDDEGDDAGDGPLEFESVSASNVVANTDETSQTFAFVPSRDLADGETVRIDLDDPQDSGAGGGQPLIVDYPSGDSEGGTIAIDQGSGSAVLEQTGRRNAELHYTAGPEGDDAGSEIRLTVNGVAVGDIAGNEYDVVFETDADTQATTFGVAETAGDRTIDGNVDGNVYSTGSLTLRQNAVVNGDADADESVTLEYRSEVSGGITGDNDVTVGQEAVVGDDIDADGAVSLGYQAEVSGGITSERTVTLEQESVVGGDVDATGSVSLGYDAAVEGSIVTDGAVTMSQLATVSGDVTADSVDLGYETAIDGDVFVGSASDIDCGGESTINGQSCERYVAENY